MAGIFWLPCNFFEFFLGLPRPDTVIDQWALHGIRRALGVDDGRSVGVGNLDNVPLLAHTEGGDAVGHGFFVTPLQMRVSVWSLGEELNCSAIAR